MLVTELHTYGIPESVIAQWRMRQGEQLLPLQIKAIRRGLLGRPGCPETPDPNLLLLAPTSSGKSFCAELACARALSRQQSALLLTPLKSLAAETAERFNRVFAPLGITCLLVTGDHPENDRRFYSGRFRLAVAIYEKLDQLLVDGLDRLRTIGVVVVDELQMIAEPARGPALERLLTKLRLVPHPPRLVTLSAVISPDDAARVAGWLGAELIDEQIRPVELERGVAAGGRFRYRRFNSGQIGEESFSENHSAASTIDTVLEQLRHGQRPSLVFVKSRRDAIQLSFRLAQQVDWPEAADAIRGLMQEEPSYLVRSLLGVLRRGIGFHSADLSARQRLLVEQAFRCGEVQTLFCTTTLALGVNLPAATVYIETVKYATGRTGGRALLEPLSRAEFDNLSGRAGRYGQAAAQPGRAVIVAETEFDRDVLWQQYIAERPGEPLRSALHTEHLADLILHLLATGLLPDRDHLYQALGRTLAATHAPFAEEAISRAVEQLIQDRLVNQESGSYQLAPLAVGLLRSGLTIKQGIALSKTLSGALPQTECEWLAAALTAPDWELPAGMVSSSEARLRLPLQALYREKGELVAPLARQMPAALDRQTVSYRHLALLKSLLLLEDWRALRPLTEIEERYQLHLGQIQALAEAAAHLVNGLAGLAQASSYPEPLVQQVRALAGSVRRGIPVALLKLDDQFGRRLDRPGLLALSEAGVEERAELEGQSLAQLVALLGDEAKALVIHEFLNSLQAEDEMKSTAVIPTAVAGSRPVRLELVGSFDGDRYLVRIDGLAVRLTGKSFKYLCKLAWARKYRGEGWLFRDEIEQGFNQARYLYRLKQEVNSQTMLSWVIAENNRLGYYRLDLEPEGITINSQGLREFPDIEVSGLVTDRSAGKAEHPGLELS